jgi:DNA mismatch repair protein MutS
MRQYLDVKARYPDAIVFFRLGDFYEMFYEDAVYVARALNLTLTTRDKGKEDPVPMCGVPHHAVRGYLAKLTELGHRVALCEQLEDPKVARGIVRGVVLDEESLDPRQPRYVAAVAGEPRQGYGLAFLDVTTGEFHATEAATIEGLLDELGRAEPRELVVLRADTDIAAAVRRGYPHLPQTAVTEDTAWSSATEPTPWRSWPPVAFSAMRAARSRGRGCRSSGWKCSSAPTTWCWTNRRARTSS